MRTELTLKWQLGDFPRDPVNKTWCIHCREHALISDWGTKILHAAQQGQKRKKKKQQEKEMAIRVLCSSIIFMAELS